MLRQVQCLGNSLVFSQCVLYFSSVHPCEKSESPCKNEGVCEKDEDEFICKCTEDWTGKTCEIKGKISSQIKTSAILKIVGMKTNLFCIFIQFILVISQNPLVRMKAFVKRMETILFVNVLKIGLEKLVK